MASAAGDLWLAAGDLWLVASYMVLELATKSEKVVLETPILEIANAKHINRDANIY